VGREGEGLSSNRPEPVDLWEFLEAHPDNENQLYLTDNEATLQVTNKWIGGGDFCILEHNKYSESSAFWNTISTVIQIQGWRVEQIRFITGARSVNKQDLSNNLKFFNVPEDTIQSTYSKLAMRVFDVYANIFKYMYNTRFSGGPTRLTLEACPEAQQTPIVGTPVLRTMAYCKDYFAVFARNYFAVFFSSIFSFIFFPCFRRDSKKKYNATHRVTQPPPKFCVWRWVWVYLNLG
jgi:hypothetical protein